MEEIRTLEPVPSIVGYRARFRYCIAGQPIRSGAYPPVVVLYRRLGPRYVQDGHTQRVQVAGGVAELQGRIDHDDRKSLSRWLKSQHNYARQEAEHLAGARYADLNVIDRMRCRIWPMPFLMFGYCFVWRGGFLDGWRGLQYALERTYAELLLSLELLSRRLLGDPAAPE